MNIQNLIKKLLVLPQGVPVTLDFGGDRRGVKKVTTVIGHSIAVIEAGDGGMTVAGVVAELSRITGLDGYGKKSLVELFATSGDDYGYYNVGQVLDFKSAGMARITAGSFISGGV